MKKSIFLFFAAILCVTSAWAGTYYYSGEGNNTGWSKKAMTVSTDGFYEYYKVSSKTTHQFKIGTSSDQYAYNYTYVQKGFNSTNVTNIGDYGTNNCYCWHGSTHYILVYKPKTAINQTDKPIICASTTLPDSRNHGFEQDNNGIKFYHGSDTEWKFNGQTAQTKNLNTITQLYLKEWFVQLYENWDGAKGNVKMQYNIHLAKNTPGNYTDIEKNWTDGQDTWSNYYSNPKYGNNSLDINLLEGLGSGEYTMSFKYYDKDLDITSPIHKLNWTIAVPDIVSAECTSNGTGLGTEESPFMIPVGETLTLTVDGEQSFSDANSVLNVKFGDNAYSSTVTYTLTPTTTKQSITIKVKYYNSTDDLSGTEETLIVYFEALEEETNDVIVSYLCNSNPIAGHGEQTVAVGVTTPSGINAPAITGYTFSSWNLGSGVQSADDATTNPINITTKSGETDYTLVANYNEDLTSGWVLRGSFVDDFATAYDFTKKSGESTGRVAYTTVELLANTEYHFKVVKDDTWYGNSNNTDGEKWWIKQTTENWTFKSSDGGDCYMKSGLAGTYTFKIDYSGANPKVSVIYPIAYTITATAENGTVEGAGTYVEGTTISLTATPAEGYHFVKWSNESTTNPLTITVTKDIELQAIFDINTYTVTATAENGTVTGAGEYTHGTEVTLTATPAFDYQFVKWSNESTENPLTITVTEDVTLEAIFEEVVATTTTLSGKFSTGKYEYAEFATGNLQHNPKSGDWRFAKQQYQYVGNDNIYVGKEDYKGWIDLFGWSADDKFGVNPSNDNTNYQGEFVDWGTLFPEEGWSTLSKEQWDYLLNKRDASLKQIAMVGETLGIMLFPDEWTLPAGCAPTKQTHHDEEDGEDLSCDFVSYNYTLAQWIELEKAGAIFLPAAGRRTGGWGNTTVSPHIVGTAGDKRDADGHYKHYADYYAYYWTSTKTDGKVNYLINCTLVDKVKDTYTVHAGHVNWAEEARYGQSVRLAKVTSTAYTRTVTNGNYGTICLPYASSNYTGMELYEVSWLKEGTGLYLDQLAAGAALVAGKPYIFKATASEIAVTYEGEEALTPVAGENGLTGTFTKIDKNTDLVGHYIIAQNQIWVANDQNTLPANRAYIDKDGVPTTEQPKLAGRRRVCMGENAATGLDNITNGENTTIKVIENGQLIIIRNGEKFNAQGVRF